MIPRIQNSIAIKLAEDAYSMVNCSHFGKLSTVSITISYMNFRPRKGPQLGEGLVMSDDIMVYPITIMDRKKDTASKNRNKRFILDALKGLMDGRQFITTLVLFT